MAKSAEEWDVEINRRALLDGYRGENGVDWQRIHREVIAAAQAEARAEAMEEARAAIRREADNHRWSEDVAETAVVLAGVAIDGLLAAPKVPR